MADIQQAKQRPIHKIAKEINDTWSKQGTGVNFAARPYLNAMLVLDGPRDTYGNDSADTILHYFLSNARSFRGPDAKRLKTEIKAVLG